MSDGVRRRPSLGHRLQAAGLYALRALYDVIPERAAVRLGSFVGLFAGTVLRVRRRDVDRHLAWAFPDRTPRWRSRTARASYAHLGRESVVMLRRGGWQPERIRQSTAVIGFDRFREAACGPGGVVLLTGHLGNWEIGGAALAARGLELDVVGKGLSNRSVEALLLRTRERLGMRVIPMVEAAREVPRSLGRGGLVAMLWDQRAVRGAIPVRFFGRPAATARGPGRFAVRSGARVFFAVATRDPGREQRYTVRFEELRLRPSADEDDAVAGLASAYAAALEERVRAAPDQYFWHHRRWKGGTDEEQASDGQVITGGSERAASDRPRHLPVREASL